VRTVFKSAPPRSFLHVYIYIKVSRRLRGINNFPSCFLMPELCVCMNMHAISEIIHNKSCCRMCIILNGRMYRRPAARRRRALSAIGIALTKVAIKSIKKIRCSARNTEKYYSSRRERKGGVQLCRRKEVPSSRDSAVDIEKCTRMERER